MGTAQGLYPRTERVDDFGGRVAMNVDGGRGGDLDEVLATLATITTALERLEAYDPKKHQVALLYAVGRTQVEIGVRIGQSQRVVSSLMAQAESFLAALLGGGDGVLRGRG